jgi:hypothetical protein
MVDFARLGVRQMVEIRDTVRFEIIGASQAVIEFGDGVYLTYTSNTSLRIRVNQIRNGDASASAVFFDPI